MGWQPWASPAQPSPPGFLTFTQHDAQKAVARRGESTVVLYRPENREQRAEMLSLTSGSDRGAPSAFVNGRGMARGCFLFQDSSWGSPGSSEADGGILELGTRRQHRHPSPLPSSLSSHGAEPVLTLARAREQECVLTHLPTPQVRGLRKLIQIGRVHV